MQQCVVNELIINTSDLLTYFLTILVVRRDWTVSLTSCHWSQTLINFPHTSLTYTLHISQIPILTNIEQQAELSLGKPTVLPHSTFGGHVTSSVTWPFDSLYAISYWWSFGTTPLSLTVSEIFNVETNAMVDVTLIRPLNKGQGYSFWYQSISYIRLIVACQ